ncbi:MAG: hypothetical protein ABSC11_02190 [Smithella sp.]|jgi:hypothetical protein
MDIQTSKDLEFVIAALPSFGTRYAHLVMGYAQIFGVTPMHLKAKKLRLIIEEMKKLFDAQSFTWEKKTYSISHAGIAEALDVMIKRNWNKALTNHNYLKQVMIDISEREATGKSIQEEKTLRKREQSNLRGDERPDVPEPRGPIHPGDEEITPGKLTPDQVKNNLTRVGNIIKSIAGKTA